MILRNLLAGAVALGAVLPVLAQDAPGWNPIIRDRFTADPAALVVGDTVYLCTPHDWVIALDAETGKEKWKYDPKIAERKNLIETTAPGRVPLSRAPAPRPRTGKRPGTRA